MLELFDFFYFIFQSIHFTYATFLSNLPNIKHSMGLQFFSTFLVHMGLETKKLLLPLFI